jgi:Tol biopolymer transport system component
LQSRGSTLTFEVSRDRRDLATIDAVDLSSGSQAQLSRDAGNDQSPTLAPDGTLAYTKGTPGHAGWAYCLAIHGRCEKTMTGRAIAEPAAWSPDGRRLAVLDAVKGGIDLSLVDAATGAARVVHRFANYLVRSSIHGNSIVVGGVYTVGVSSPSWSPDGTKIVVASDQPGTQEAPLHESDLWLVDVASGRTSELLPDLPAVEPSWSPDGATIAFTTQQDSPGIELYDVATSTVTPLVSLTPGTDATSRPAWSPDSSQLAYQEPDGSLHVISRDGSDDRQVVTYALPGGSIAWRR